MKVFIDYRIFEKEHIERLKETGVEIINREDNPSIEELEDVDGIISAWPFKNYDVKHFKNLKWIQLMMAGINHLPLEELRQKNVKISNAKHIYSIPIAEWIIMRLLEISKKSFVYYEESKEKKWEQRLFLPELYSKKAGLLGAGSIAQETAKRLNSFGVETIGFNRKGSFEEHFDKVLPISNIADEIYDLDYLILALPDTAETKYIVNKELLAKADEDLIIVNIGRGNSIDENALIDYLNKNKNANSALDVFEIEPLPEDSPLWEMDNVIVTPHISFSSDLILSRLLDLSIKAIENQMEGKGLVNPVDIDKGY